MKIFYTASYHGKGKYQKNYDQVREALEVQKIDLISPEKDNYLQLLSASEKQGLTERQIHYEAVRKGILWADAVVIEISEQDFQLGHEATLAIQAKKRVLCLSIHEDFEQKITNRYFFGAKYNEYTIGEIIEEFINKAKRGLLTERFNCFLSPNQVRHLEVMGVAKEMNMSEYLRELIEADQRVTAKIPPPETKSN